MRKIFILIILCCLSVSTAWPSVVERPLQQVSVTGPHFLGSPLFSVVDFDEYYRDILQRANTVYFEGAFYSSFNFQDTKTAFSLGGQSLILDEMGVVIHYKTVQNYLDDKCLPLNRDLLPHIQRLDEHQLKIDIGLKRIFGRPISGGSPSRLGDIDNVLPYDTLMFLRAHKEIRERARQVIVNLSSPNMPCGGSPALSAHPDNFHSNCTDGQALIVAEAIRNNINMEIRHIAENPYRVHQRTIDKLKDRFPDYDLRIKETPVSILRPCREGKVYKRVATFNFNTRWSNQLIRVLQEFGCGRDPRTGEFKYFVITKKAPPKMDAPPVVTKIDEGEYPSLDHSLVRTRKKVDVVIPKPDEQVRARQPLSIHAKPYYPQGQ